ncbi:hypothetical protein BSKO_04287 [Bryopsis sp. KO-2023]|nr:hypothetical protein BSKO_04287 [Bryopsis sp. KO-2023]
MARFAATALICASLIAVAFAGAEDFPFPDSIAVCGQGVCKVVGVIKNEMGMATGIGPVPADAELGQPGDYPALFSLCGLLTCVTVPVVKEAAPDAPDAVPEAAPGTSVSTTCPASIGLCGDGGCKVVPVNINDSGAAVSVGPVMAKGGLGAAGSYPTNVGVCCDGVCKALPVMVQGGRKML